MQRPGPFGLSLPNRAVLFGAITVEQMIHMAEVAEQTGAFDSVWVGDSVLAKPRLESVATLAALAVRTRRMLLGTACMASFPLRHALLFAQQWASLDVISNGRTILVPCIGSGTPGAGGEFYHEYAAFGVDPQTRMARLEEGVTILRRLWTEEQVTHRGAFYVFENVTLQPRPVQKPCPPIWIASSPSLSARPHLVERAFRRVARLGDGWMADIASAAHFQTWWSQIAGYVREAGRDPDDLDTAVHHMVNINDDADKAYAEAKQFLDLYYTTDTTPERMQTWVSYGPPEAVARKISAYFAAGARTMILRFASWEPVVQIERAVRDVLPRVQTGRGA
ncbi:MAG: LLM class flavin-dependent oxidoreductase [Chloroflexi bacterium]|nr:LLM class flavin-dependent oxidoreductase [Chloroflexota bacterium]